MHAATAIGQVRARLIADTTRVKPGVAFTAAVQLTIAPGWHVYWENPGDTALPVTVDWKLPAGAKVSPLRWPEPERYAEKDGAVVFGYEREALLLASVIPSGAIRLGAKVEWLVCEKVCIPGDATLRLELPAGEPALSADAATIQKYAAKVPLPGAPSGVRMTEVQATKEGERWRLRIEVDPSGRRVLGFFPRSMEAFAIEHRSIVVKGNTIEFSALPDEPELQPHAVSGVVVTDRGSFDVAGEVGTKLAAAAPARQASDDWLAQRFTGSGTARPISLPMLIFFSALGGLLLNVMPCVLPVISLKVLSFVQQAGHDPRRTRFLGVIFGAGVIFSFWILAAVVAAFRSSAQQIGWGFQFQSPVFVVVMSAVVVAFAMSLFGVFELSAPVVSGSMAAGHGASGAFMQGMLATILATPCTAPFLGTAIGFAFTQPVPILFVAFTSAGAGLALPYVLLSWNPAWLRWLPRPGAWMNAFKQAMGFLLLGTVVWLLSVIGAQLGPEGVVWTIAFLIVFAFAVWVVGRVPYGAPAAKRWTWRIVALVVIACAYFFAFEHELRWRQPITAAESGTRWEPFSLDGLRMRVERGETVLVDFTADWCWNCKVNERTVLSSSAVEKTIRDLNVTPMKADWTKRNPEITRLLAKFGRAGVPFYVVFPGHQLTSPIALSEIITPDSVVDALERAGPSRAQTP